jgi:hypothetical protein
VSNVDVPPLIGLGVDNTDFRCMCLALCCDIPDPISVLIVDDANVVVRSMWNMLGVTSNGWCCRGIAHMFHTIHNNGHYCNTACLKLAIIIKIE